MERYWEMRLSDYYIQSYTRYGMQAAADQDIIEAFNERNIQLEQRIAVLLDELGIPRVEKGTLKMKQ